MPETLSTAAADSATRKLHGFPRLLVSRKVLSRTAVCEALDQAGSDNRALIDYLLQQQLVEGNRLAFIIAQAFSLPWLDLDAYDLERCPVALIDVRLLRKHQVLPLARHQQRMTLAMAEPGHADTLQELQFHSGFKIEPVIVAADKLAAAVTRLAQQHDLSLYARDDAASLELETLPAQAETEPAEAGAMEDERPLVRFVNKLLLDALEARASDLHLEPYERSYRVRFRIDGLLHEVSRPPLSVACRIAARLKVMAQLDIAEKRLPQDGRIRVRLAATRVVDFRLNTLPTLWGEKLVLRLLETGRAGLGIDVLGFESSQQQLYLRALNRQQGLVLVTGPTGSGKTATLYAGLRVLNSNERNIASAEDPVEMPLEGINQVAVNRRLGLGFAEILRAFLRQDPDILMIGEIRDVETADIAIKAAQSGHLVLSTLHTNSAADSLARLANMGVAPYNVASALRLVISQRLLRRLCQHCKETLSLPENTLKKSGLGPVEGRYPRLFQPVGCNRCRGGYRGRVAIYEVVPIVGELSRLIIENRDSGVINDCVRKLGYPGLRQAALAKVSQGLSSLEEANRLT